MASGYVLDTLKAALWASAGLRSFEDALIGAVNLGDDADTVGAVAGALAGALYGEAAIPARWASALLVRDRVLAAADGLADLAFPATPRRPRRSTRHRPATSANGWLALRPCGDSHAGA